MYTESQEGLRLQALTRLFPTEEAAYDWFEGTVAAEWADVPKVRFSHLIRPKRWYPYLPNAFGILHSVRTMR